MSWWRKLFGGYEGPPTVKNKKDGSRLLLIPAGKFIAGGWGENEGGGKFELTLPAFYIGLYPVTVRQYKRFVKATGHEPPAPCNWEAKKNADKPVVHVSWTDAEAYCRWAGGRLPSELEWEKTARGVDGREYPWGNFWKATNCRNSQGWLDAYWAAQKHHQQDSSIPERSKCDVWAYPHGASPWGALQMSGNVWEWCEDWHEEGAYDRYKQGDLAAPTSGDGRVVRGGSYTDDNQEFFRCCFRSASSPDSVNLSIGFRLAMDSTAFEISK